MKEKLLTSFQTLNSDLSVDLFQSYYKHIITSTADESQYTERHHILPKAIFPEYKSESWNIVKLSAKDHFLAHYLLFKMFPVILVYLDKITRHRTAKPENINKFKMFPDA